MDMPLAQALFDKLGLVVSEKSEFLSGQISSEFLGLMQESRWLDNGHIAIIDPDDESFTFDPDDVPGEHIYTLLTYGFSLLQILPDYNEDEDDEDPIQPPSQYALISPLRPMIKVLPRMKELLKEKLGRTPDKIIMLTHAIDSF